MKKFYSVTAIVVMSLALSFAASAATNDAGKTQQESSQESTVAGDGAAGQAVGSGQEISGENDIRVITPDMNFRQRVEAQRAIQKRAAASRNALIQAEMEKQQQSESAGTDGQPAAK